MRSTISGQICGTVTLRKWNSQQTFGTGSGRWLKRIILLCTEQWQWIRNEFGIVRQYRRVCKQGGVVVPRYQCASHPAFSIKPLIYGHFAPLRLFISSHVCLVSFPLPRSNRFFRGRAGLWAAGEGVGQEEVGDQRIAFPCASPLLALRLSIQLLLKQHTPTWAIAIHTHLFGRGLTHEQEIHMYVMHLILRALQIKSFLRFWLVCGCSFYTIFSPSAHTLEPTQTSYMHTHKHTHLYMPLHSDSSSKGIVQNYDSHSLII